MEFPVFQSVTIVYSLRNTANSLVPLWPYFSLVWKIPVLSHPPCTADVPVTESLSWPSARLNPLSPCLLYLGLILQIWPFQYLVEGKVHVTQPVGNALPTVYQDVVLDFFATSPHCWLLFNLSASTYNWVFAKLLSSQLPQLALVFRIISPQVQEFVLHFLELYKIPVSLWRSFLMAAQSPVVSIVPPHTVLSCKISEGILWSLVCTINEDIKHYEALAVALSGSC